MSYEVVFLSGPLNMQTMVVDEPSAGIEVDYPDRPGVIHCYELLDRDEGRRRLMYTYLGDRQSA